MLNMKCKIEWIQELHSEYLKDIHCLNIQSSLLKNNLRQMQLIDMKNSKDKKQVKKLGLNLKRNWNFKD